MVSMPTTKIFIVGGPPHSDCGVSEGLAVAVNASVASVSSAFPASVVSVCSTFPTSVALSLLPARLLEAGEDSAAGDRACVELGRPDTDPGCVHQRFFASG